MKFYIGWAAFFGSIALMFFALYTYWGLSYVSDEKVVLEFLHVDNPPKHFQATFRNVATGALYRNVNVSKHFNRWRELQPGVRITVRRVGFVRNHTLLNRDRYDLNPVEHNIYYRWEGIYEALNATLIGRTY